MSLRKFVLNMVAGTLFFPALMLWLSGDPLWVEGWLFALWFDVMVLYSSIYMYRKDPALLAERTKAPGSDNQKVWDKYVLVFVYVLFIVWTLILPLDARRFGWSPAFPLWIKFLGGLMLLPALYLIERTTMENTYMSTLVRIQSERRQRVISSGVYGFVRHPLYLGCALMMFGAPLMVGSLYGLILAGLGMAVVVGRIFGEERMLAEELEGYTEYQQRVRYRLIPHVW